MTLAQSCILTKYTYRFTNVNIDVHRMYLTTAASSFVLRGSGNSPRVSPQPLTDTVRMAAPIGAHVASHIPKTNDFHAPAMAHHAAFF